MSLKTLNSVGGFSVSDSSGNAIIIIDDNGNVSTNQLTVTGQSNLGSNANVIIGGGVNGQVLSTDGAGNLSWSSSSSGGFLQIFLRSGNIANISITFGSLQIVGRSGIISVPIS
jgi:hypothetical protein